MKTLLTKFFTSLSCKLMWAVVATAAAANAHDLPSDCPLAYSDWGLLQQDCLGAHEIQGDSPAASISDSASKPDHLKYLALAPDIGEPPRPSKIASLLSDMPELAVSPKSLFDGTDCSILESQFRGYPLVAATAARVKPAPKQSHLSVDSTSEFDKLYYGNCNCEFENYASTNLDRAPQFNFNLKCLEASSPFQFGNARWRFMDQIGLAAENPSTTDIVPLAIAAPTAKYAGVDSDAIQITIQSQWNERVFGDMLGKLESWNCALQSELYDCHRAFRLGSDLASVSTRWYQETLPKLAGTMNRFVPTTVARATETTPMFVLYSFGKGKSLAIPAEQARQWNLAETADLASLRAATSLNEALESEAADSESNVSPEFQALVQQADMRLKWAGGRLSQAAVYLNDWFSIRVARSMLTSSIR